MKSSQMLFSLWARFAVLAFVFSTFDPAEVAAQFFCNRPNLVDVTFTAGTRWRFCWEMRQREGLVINRAFYTQRGGPEREVLFRGSVAQVHVPYHRGSPRFHDVTTATSGLGAGALNLTTAECSPGVLLTPQVCRDVDSRGYAFKFGSGAASFQKGQALTIYISSQLGQYNYITRWTFNDDGSIEPSIGFTGRLQVTSTAAEDARFGTRLSPESAPTQLFGINHFHHIYWRLDFDIGSANNNAVDQIFTSQYFGPPFSSTNSCMIAGECHINEFFRITNEALDFLDSPFRSWRVFNKSVLNQNGRTIGYEIVPRDNQFWFGRFETDEPWSFGELFVTTFNFCEQLATENQPPFISAACAGAATNVREMISEGSNVDGADIVVWYVQRFQHHVREEDQLNMPIEFTGPLIQPRSWRHKNTLEP